jgi:hypothetical protein
MMRVAITAAAFDAVAELPFGSTLYEAKRSGDPARSSSSLRARREARKGLTRVSALLRNYRGHGRARGGANS